MEDVKNSVIKSHQDMIKVNIRLGEMFDQTLYQVSYLRKSMQTIANMQTEQNQRKVNQLQDQLTFCQQTF
jgi:hypothetical protein